MLLPLSSGKVRALSLENHLAFATVCAGQANVGQIVNLLRVIYLAFYLRTETTSGATLRIYQQAEAALDACIGRAESGERWMLLDDERAAVERVLAIHDEQLVAVPKHRYLAAWDRLQRFITSTSGSPVPAAQAE
ncbi:hypothetical protein VOI32_35995 [Paraburkholderia caribensis]|nr:MULTISPECIES: hypothetical protein [Paraburkholderia]MCO4881772.1 hypothetical protein [Paraburkholderia caribensis]PTB24162.1 hypothetical protein C9I56_35340 [Paraburkholderia caribensis]